MPTWLKVLLLVFPDVGVTSRAVHAGLLLQAGVPGLPQATTAADDDRQSDPRPASA